MYSTAGNCFSLRVLPPLNAGGNKIMKLTVRIRTATETYEVTTRIGVGYKVGHSRRVANAD